MSRGFTISVSSATDRIGFLPANSKDAPVPLERANRFAFEITARDHAEFLEREGLVAKGLYLTVCDADGWAILRPIDTQAISQAVAKAHAMAAGL